MTLKRRLINSCLVLLADTLADLEGLWDEIRSDSGTVRPAGGLRHDGPDAGRERARGRRGLRPRTRRDLPSPAVPTGGARLDAAGSNPVLGDRVETPRVGS